MLDNDQLHRLTTVLERLCDCLDRDHEIRQAEMKAQDEEMAQIARDLFGPRLEVTDQRPPSLTVLADEIVNDDE